MTTFALVTCQSRYHILPGDDGIILAMLDIYAKDEFPDLTNSSKRRCRIFKGRFLGNLVVLSRSAGMLQCTIDGW